LEFIFTLKISLFGKFFTMSSKKNKNTPALRQKKRLRRSFSEVSTETPKVQPQDQMADFSGDEGSDHVEDAPSPASSSPENKNSEDDDEELDSNEMKIECFKRLLEINGRYYPAKNLNILIAYSLSFQDAYVLFQKSF